jgi:GNAT superfamily N-acetyltransferase
VIPPDVVAAASRAWNWVPPNAVKVETDEYLLLRMPEWFGIGLELMRVDPVRPVAEVVAEVLEEARAFGLPSVHCWVKLHNDPALEAELVARGGVPDETLDVLALDLTRAAPDLHVPAPLELRWATDLETVRDGLRVAADVFGDSMPPEHEIQAEVERAREDAESGSGSVVAYLDGVAVGCGGLSLVDGVARLWGGAVREGCRGRGAYRAVLEARLRRAAEREATMALVKGRVETSGPVLRRAGFVVYGQERSFTVPLS